MEEVKRGQLWYCNFGDDAIGSEQSGIRPCVIVQNNKGNKFSPTTIVSPITTQVKAPLPTHVRIDSLKRPSTIVCEQVRTVDKRRLIDCIGALSIEEYSAMDNAIKISMGV